MKPAAFPGERAALGGRYRFDGTVVDIAAHTLTRDGLPCQVEPKAFAVLLVLLEHAGELVGRDDLLDMVWGHRHVTPGVLTRAIAQLRAALGDDSQQPRYIQTQHALGYRFIGDLQPPPGDEAGDDAAMANAAAPTAAAPDGTAMLSDTVPVPQPPAAGTVATSAGPVRSPMQRRVTDAMTPLPAWRESHRFHRGRGWAWFLPLALLLAGTAWWALDRRGATPRAADASIAVLPFTTLSDDRQDRYFAEGLAAEMHSALAGVHGLKVAAWMPPSARTADEDAMALGKRLGVATVLDASVRREMSRVRITARLTDTSSGFIVWSRTYDRDISDVFATQGDMAQELVNTLGGLLPDTGEGLRKRLAPTRNVAAFDAYLRGLQALMQGSEGKEAAAAYFQQALSQDGGFARAQAGLCDVELWRFEYTRNVDAFDNAKLACLRAENMDPTMGAVRLALGNLYLAKGDTDKAADLYGKLEHDPEVRSDALVGLARVMEAKGQHEQAIELFQKALAHSPGDGYVHASMGYQQAGAGKMQDAIASYRRAVELDPGSANYWSTLGSLLLETGSNEDAERAIRRSLAIEPRASAFNNLGTLRYQAADYAGAVSLYRQATTLNPGHFLLWGYLGDGLLADPDTASEAGAAFRQAASLAERYVASKPEDAKALAALGWYRANLRDGPGAYELVRQSEKFVTVDRGDVALFNAQTTALLGDMEQSRRWVQAARAAGIPDNRIHTNAILIRTQVVPSRQTRK